MAAFKRFPPWRPEPIVQEISCNSPARHGLGEAQVAPFGARFPPLAPGATSAVRGGCAEKILGHSGAKPRAAPLGRFPPCCPRRLCWKFTATAPLGLAPARPTWCRLGDSRLADPGDCAGNFLQHPRPTEPRQSPKWRRFGDSRPAAQRDCAGNFLQLPRPSRPRQSPEWRRLARFPPCSPRRLCRKFPETAPPGRAPRCPEWRRLHDSRLRPRAILQEIYCNSPALPGPGKAQSGADWAIPALRPPGDCAGNFLQLPRPAWLQRGPSGAV